MVARPVPADWLALRRRADHRAREDARDLLELLTDHLRTRGGDELVVVDVGAGTGSNQAWLAPRLPGRQRWVLVDHDADLLEHEPAAEADDRITTERAVVTVEDLPALLPRYGAVLLTCAALLDLLSEAEIETLADVVAPDAAPGVAALLSLSVTGEVALMPGHPADTAVTAAFDAHQRREGRPGPDAAEVMARALRRRGARVELRATDWVLAAQDEPLLRRYLDDRAAVAVEHDPELAPVVREWLEERSHQLEAASLRARVGHLDLLSLPPETVDEGCRGGTAEPVSDSLVASRPRPHRGRLVVGATLQVVLTLGLLGLLGLVVAQWGLSPFVTAAGALPWWAVAVGLGLGGAGVVLQALRWRLVARHHRISLPVGPAVARCWQAAFLNSVLPGGVAGDALRAADDSSDAQAPDGRGALASGFAAVAAERLVGTTVALLAAAVALLGPVPLVGVACLAGAAVTAAVAWRWLRVLPLRDLALVLLLSVAGWAAFVAMFVLAVVVVAPEVEVSLAPGLATVSVAAMSVPITVGGWGTREAAAGWIFMVRGLDMGTGVTVSIGYGILALLSTLPGAAILAVRTAPRLREVGRARSRRDIR